MFKPVDAFPNFPKIEEEILEFWKKNKIFEKSIEKRQKSKDWTFLDGPPFVTGSPHYGSLLSSLPKDLFGRYWTMKGYHVRRVWGWDGHGLPIENKVENALKIKRKRDIEEKVGVKKFIEECRKYVEDVSSEWEWYVDHIGRWVDFKNAYKTWDLDYMESVMWVFKQMYDKGYIYKGLRVSLYCPHCSTPISNFEVAMDAENYKEVTEPAATYKYKLKGEKNTYLLAWSTTPWNKIVTPALAVNPKLKYLKVKQGDGYLILAKQTKKILKEKPSYDVIEEFPGSKLVGKEFELHYDFYKKKANKRIGVIVGGNFVTAEEGTGVVTLAVYGEEDLEIMQKENIELVFHVNDEGIINEDVSLFGKMSYLEANHAVNKDLEKRGLLYRKDPHTHTIAHCWRCETRLFYNPQDAWYVNVQTLKDRMKKANEKVNWAPKHFKYGRFLKSVENAPDWNISRSRYWGSPVPVWECECGERFVPGSIKELEEVSGRKIKDLHKPEIDEVTIKCKKCGRTVKRVPEVLDSWIEAGSASFAERHFPFNKEYKLEDFFPPDFIAEYTGQIRAWFYVLHVIGSALYNSPAFRNVLVEGVILGTDGRKMSKNYGNFPDPKQMLRKYGGDALRLYLMGSPVMKGEDILISEEHYRNQVRGIMLVLWNVYRFFITNALVDNWAPVNQEPKPKNILDKWILSRLNENIINTTAALNKFDSVDAIGQAEAIFINDLSNWYVRRIRDRVGPTAVNKEDKNQAYQTMWWVLKEYSKILAPIIPFLTEEMYKNLTNEESVHLVDWPLIPPESINETDLKKLGTLKSKVTDESLESQMERAKDLASKIHAFRKNNSLKVRIPLKKLEYKGSEEIDIEILKVVLNEVNVYKLAYKGKADEYEVNGEVHMENQDTQAGEAREIIRRIQNERKKLGTKLDEKVDVQLADWPKEFEKEIKRKTLIRNLKKGKEFKVEKV
ncbi:isoleucine--tRNA ligase [Candidatus Roizmanbacteria bacterium]|nr:isoleucine--tRNA ligase [Candidatus Roizmanbacteria bacterium]